MPTSDIARTNGEVDYENEIWNKHEAEAVTDKIDAR